MKKVLVGLLVLAAIGSMLIACLNPIEGAGGANVFPRAVALNDADKAAAAIIAPTVSGRTNASGKDISSNGQGAAVPGMYFFWDPKQKDNGYLKVEASMFDKYKSFILTSKEADKYWDFLIQAQDDQVLTADGFYVFFIPKQEKNINGVWISEYSIITTLAIKGIDIPMFEGIPVTTITETDKFTGTVTWYPDHSVFAVSTQYIATITLTPKPDFTFEDVPADYFTVSGATATNEPNSGIVTAVFPKTESGPKIDGRIIVAKPFTRQNSGPFLTTVNNAKRLGANQFLVFGDQVLRAGCPEILTDSGIDLWLIAPIFYHDDNGSNNNSVTARALGRQPYWAICADGELAWEARSPNPASDGTWLRIVCPNDIEYLNYRIESFKPALRACKFTGISLDFIRYFVYWEGTRPETNPQSLRDSCFCDNCVTEFAAIADVTVTGTTAVEKAGFIRTNFAEQWTDYKCGKIDKTVEYILAEIRKEFPYLQSNLHAVPFTSTDHDGAIKRIAGQDFDLLSRRFDQISPMTYNLMKVRPAQWINDVACDIVSVIGNRVPVTPTVQLNEYTRLAEIEDAVKNAIKPTSSGVVLWHIQQTSSNSASANEALLQAIERGLAGN